MSREMKHSGIEWIGEIPKEWKVVRTKNVFFVGKDLVGSKSSQTQLLSLTTMGIKKVSIGSTSGKVPNSYDTYQLVHKDNLVFCLFDLDCSAVFSGVSNYEGMISPAYKVLSVQKGYYPQFYGYWFDYIFDGRKYKFLSKNIRYSLTYDEFAALGIVAPNYEEQQKIANYLDKVCGEVDEMIALQEQMIEELKAYKQSVITEAVTKGLNPDVPMRDSGIDWIGEIPEHWKVTVLRRFATIILGKMLQPNAKSDDDTLEQYICAKDVHFEGIDFSDLKKMYFDKNEKETYQVQKGDMLVVEGGAGAAGSCVLKTDLPDTYIQNSIMIVRPKQGIDIRYIQYFEFSLVKKGYVDFVCNKATIPHFTKDKLSSMPIPLPPLSEQQSIASYLDTKCAEIDALIAIKQAKIEELKDYKKSVIYEYVTGKKEVV